MLLKLDPEMITVAPTAPLVGSNPEIDGEGNTVKLKALLIVIPLVVTEIGPVTAPGGTVVVILVALEEVTIAAVPLKDTEGEALKFVPEIITVAPMAPLVGLEFEIVGVGRTIKLEELVRVIPLTTMEIEPDVAAGGTVAVILVAVEEETLASVPLKLTIFSEGVALKFVPEMVTTVPMAPLGGLNPVIVGVAKTVKLPPL